MFENIHLGNRGVTGGNDAIGWVLTLFLIGLLGGSMVYVLSEFNASIGDINTSNAAKTMIGDIMGIFDIIPTWTKILVIVGFAGAIALVGLMLYGVFQDRTKTL